jgi:2-polyprenyl-6-methoxyphenol hydroxylase-like FAD-dependent oxidoreductase
MRGTTDRDVDVLVIGARIAGASLALLLGERGHRVLLVDRDRFPSDTLSTHALSPASVELLDRLGVLADVEACGFRRVTRVRTYVSDCLTEGPFSPNGYALAPRRDQLDAILIRHAVERGTVTFCERTQALGLIEEDGQVVGSRLRDADGEVRAIRAHVVVGADGRFSKVARWVEAPCYDEVPVLHPIYYGYFRNLTPLPETAVAFFFTPGQVGLIFPMQPGMDCLALEVQPEDFATFRANPQGVFMERFRALYGMAARLAGAELEGRIVGTPGIPNFFRKPYGPGWALTGDAAYLKDPQTGFGIGDAIGQAYLLAPALETALSGADCEGTMADYQRARDEMMLPRYEATLQATQVRDATAEELGWMRAVLSGAGLVRKMSLRFAAVVPDVFDAATQQRLDTLAQAFAAEPPPSA